MSEYYYELIIKPSKNYELFLDLLGSLTNEALEECDDNSIIARSEDDLSDIEYGVKEFAKALEIECKTTLTKKENVDWIKQYQESVKAVEVGKFYVRPSWEKPKEGKINIIIDPALSFGSGHHETTSSCLEAISEFVDRDDEVLDVGTGSGILAIAASKLECKVDICDTDEVCINDTKTNYNLNNVIFNNSWIGSANKASKEYDVVIANIVADVLTIIASDLKKCLKDNGILIISGILDKHIDKVLNKFQDMEELELIHKNEWMTVVLKK
ncbi:50S ribosomal protein L11 methyltransferase [Halarcobacter ebronensis]|uniref:Ribosomal protein L11 methyltransferase n=1 Tax=Halarcobacter ebronensis TaxID=1462615 RepID=A0A4Q0Y9T4_9BACT|nr:50S ribosomal protein L11 methyltransferase [Halarcobacter ebronensis]RXJ67002.1 50S ribosomal protein L11 methyltransferase [Halarcobacter ebronensis]